MGPDRGTKIIGMPSLVAQFPGGGVRRVRRRWIGGGGGDITKAFKINQFSTFMLPLEDHEKVTTTHLRNLASLTNLPLRDVIDASKVVMSR